MTNAGGFYFEDENGDHILCSAADYVRKVHARRTKDKRRHLKRARPGTLQAEAEEFLLKELADGPRNAAELLRIAERRDSQLAVHTLQAARRALGVEAFTPGETHYFGPPAHWRLPTPDDVLNDEDAQ